MQLAPPTINLTLNYTDEIVRRDPDKVDALSKSLPVAPEFVQLLDYLIADQLESLANIQMDPLNPIPYQFNIYYLKAKIAAFSELQQLLIK